MRRTPPAMGSANLGLRFLLEVAALLSIGLWGWQASSGLMRLVLAVAGPAAAATVWGVFAVPHDPSRSGSAPVPVPGAVRLVLELTILGGGAAMLYHTGFQTLAWIFAALILGHYLVAHRRTAWLLTSPGPPPTKGDEEPPR